MGSQEEPERYCRSRQMGDQIQQNLLLQEKQEFARMMLTLHHWRLFFFWVWIALSSRCQLLLEVSHRSGDTFCCILGMCRAVRMESSREWSLQSSFRQWILCEGLMSLCEIIWVFDHNKKICQKHDQIFWVSALLSKCLNMTPKITKQILQGQEVGITPGLLNQCLRGQDLRICLFRRCFHSYSYGSQVGNYSCREKSFLYLLGDIKLLWSMKITY